jgi:alkylation response protein AidB-like acyl-CoA dehydrogenase
MLILIYYQNKKEFMVYKSPIADFRYNLDMLGYNSFAESIDQFKDYDAETVISVVEQVAKFNEQEMVDSNKKADREGLVYVKDGNEGPEVKTPEYFKSLYQSVIDSGYIGACNPTEYGGGGAPFAMGILSGEIGIASNMAFYMGPGLSQGAIKAILKKANKELKDKYLPKMISGEWMGTMCLTEPQCGTDLGLIRTTAIPEEDYYKLNGQKIWISFGEHDLTENIIHLVLARLPDAPAGIKGISLFLVPKRLDDNSRNPIFCGGLEHKLGIVSSPTCVMNMDDAKGWMIGEPNKGMEAMFLMMNDARLKVGLQGVAMSEIAYQNALDYAKNRRQMRSVVKDKQDSDAKADNIIVHPDVRRMLMNVKSTTEAMRALCIYTSMKIDLAEHHLDESVRETAEDFAAIMTPIIKSYCSEKGFLNCSDSLQVLGGSGFTKEYPLEQYMRDVRIALIYEGTNGIQALDLVGRKLTMHKGRLLQNFQKEVQEFINENKDNEKLSTFIKALEVAVKEVMASTMWLMQNGMQDPENALSSASDYLNLVALTSLTYMWARMAKFSDGKNEPQHKTKIKTGTYFIDKFIPEIQMYSKKVQSGKSTLMEMEIEEF